MRILAPISPLAVALSILSLPASAKALPSVTFEIDGRSEEATGHRNERSTPRNSILPFSPAIAPRDSTHWRQVSIPLVKAMLLRLGYDVGRLDGRITARFKAAVFQFQRARGLTVSGTLDSATLQTLGVPSQ